MMYMLLRDSKVTTMANTISNNDNIIDSRDIIARLEELRNNRNDIIETYGESDELTRWDNKYYDELKILQAVNDDGVQYSEDWNYGGTLIRESYFVEYCKELLMDTGDLPLNFSIYIEIDWEKTSENLRVDYEEIDFDGVTYLIL